MRIVLTPMGAVGLLLGIAALGGVVIFENVAPRPEAGLPPPVPPAAGSAAAVDDGAAPAEPPSAAPTPSPAATEPAPAAPAPGSVLPAPKRPGKTLSDPQATREARALMAYLVDHYGTATLSGQHGVDNADFVAGATGKHPALVTADLIDYSPSRIEHGSNPGGGVERLLEQAKAGSVVGLMWHWNAPKDLLDKTYTDSQGKYVDARWYKGFYTNATTFDVAKALADPNSEDYKLLLRDIDAIALQLRKTSDARVPVLWRPLHEASGGWFWWGAKGPGPFKQLWRLMHDRLTNVHHLHNLIWVYTDGGRDDWYPGDDCVDVVGTDAYPRDHGALLVDTWSDLQRRFGGRKLVALTEFGGVPDVTRMQQYGVWWSYFAPWTGDLGPRGAPADVLRRTYSGGSVVSRDGLKIPR